MTHEDDLRAWAKGGYTTEAGVELLLRGFDGKFARQGEPWIIAAEEYGTSWVDFEVIPEHTGALSGGERRFLLIAASIAADVPVSLQEVIPGLDRKNLDLVLAAIAHAGGSHEHAAFPFRRTATGTLATEAPLYPWPVVE